MSYIEKCVLLSGGLEVSFSIVFNRLAEQFTTGNSVRAMKSAYT